MDNRTLGTLALILTVVILAIPQVSAATVERDMGDLTFTEPKTCTATKDANSGDNMNADVNDTIKWTVDWFSNADSQPFGTLTFTLSVNVLGAQGFPQTWTKVISNATTTFGTGQVTWTAVEGEYTVIFDITVNWDSGADSCYDSDSGSHSLNVTP